MIAVFMSLKEDCPAPGVPLPLLRFRIFMAPHSKPSARSRVIDSSAPPIEILNARANRWILPLFFPLPISVSLFPRGQPPASASSDRLTLESCYLSLGLYRPQNLCGLSEEDGVLARTPLCFLKTSRNTRPQVMDPISAKINLTIASVYTDEPVGHRIMRVVGRAAQRLAQPGLRTVLKLR